MEAAVTIKIYHFAEYTLVPAEGLLLRNGEPLSLNPKAFAVLVMLVERHGHLVSKSEMMETIWDGAFVEEGAVAKAVWFVRNALGDSAKEHFVQTVPRRGYRFIAPVSVSKGSGAYRLSDLPTSRDESDGPDRGEGKSATDVSTADSSFDLSEERILEAEIPDAAGEAAPTGKSRSKYMQIGVVSFLILSAATMLVYAIWSFIS